jgi:hypothetical protein
MYKSVLFVEAGHGESAGLEEQFGHAASFDLELFRQADIPHEAAVQATNKLTLYRVFSGWIRDSAESMRIIGRLKSLLGALRPRFDVIVVDLPPLMSDEGPALLGEVDAVVLLAEAGKTSASDIEKAAHLIGTKPLRGIVLNKVTYATPRWISMLLAPASETF